ncbi:uncharacterized protein LOC119448985 [Dermacentor silvarum]|uniref:uncharacterized protein LOC119448985 n=1 Tax=Dermacentor silvarum TaxID=543639 RepID=UPI001897F2D7|nr:uncharacterized protein LOC119448985 [Dermacentor silvarum]
MSKKEKKSRGGSQIPPSKTTELKVSARPSTPADSKKSSISEAEPKKPSIEKTAVPAVTNPINKKVFIEAVSSDSETQEPKEGTAQVVSSPIGAAVKDATLNGELTNREKARQERRRRRRKQGRRSRRKSIAPPDSEDSETENVAAEAKTSDDDDDSEEDDGSPTERRTRRSTLPQAGRKRDRVKLVDASTNTPPASMTGLVSSEATAAKSVQTSTKATQTGDVILTPRLAKGSRAQRSSKWADKKTTQEKSSPATRRPKPRIAMSDTTVVTTELRAPKATISERFYEETISTKDDSTDDPSSFSSDFLSEDAFTFSRPANVLTRRPRKSGKSKYARSTFEPRPAYSTDPAIAEGPITSESLEDVNRLCSYLPTTRGTDYVGAVETRDPRYLKSNDDANIEEYYKEVREELVEASSNDSEVRSNLATLVWFAHFKPPWVIVNLSLTLSDHDC